eukprot:57870-Prymnesium_polylepis.1
MAVAATTRQPAWWWWRANGQPACETAGMRRRRRAVPSAASEKAPKGAESREPAPHAVSLSRARERPSATSRDHHGTGTRAACGATDRDGPSVQIVWWPPSHLGDDRRPLGRSLALWLLAGGAQQHVLLRFDLAADGRSPRLLLLERRLQVGNRLLGPRDRLGHAALVEVHLLLVEADLLGLLALPHLLLQRNLRVRGAARASAGQQRTARWRSGCARRERERPERLREIAHAGVLAVLLRVRLGEEELPGLLAANHHLAHLGRHVGARGGARLGLAL